ncbi:hypothetical protein [Synechococcus sp.]|uniref:hypothetical protein n=1 Tax=Synechococcus sp. TaxID=1131 RepID=UPI0034A3E832
MQPGCTCESFCKFKCFFCWDKTHLFNGFTALADIGDLAWLRTSFLDARGILMNDQATNWAGRELNLHWGFDELRADRAIHPKDLQGCAEGELAQPLLIRGELAACDVMRQPLCCSTLTGHMKPAYFS